MAISRSIKIIGLSLAVHGLIASALWFSPPDMVTENIPEPEVIDATILPPPPIEESKDVSVPDRPVVTQPAPVIKAPKPNSSGALNQTKGQSKKAGEKADSQVTSETGKGGAEGKSKNGSAADEGQAAAPVVSVAKGPELLKGVPIDVAIKDVGFNVVYEVKANYKDSEAGGTARFNFTRNGSAYTAVLSAKASVLSFNATSNGEIRGNTVATTSFKDGGKIKVLGMESGDKFGSKFEVDYATKRVTFFYKDNKDMQDLVYDAVYDYLSALVYVQALLQAKQGSVSSFQLPVGKRKSVEKATVSVLGNESLSTYNGVFNALKVSISIPSGSIKTIQMWFVAEKNYRPLRIDLGVDKGSVSLIGREF